MLCCFRFTFEDAGVLEWLLCLDGGVSAVPRGLIGGDYGEMRYVRRFVFEGCTLVGHAILF